MLDLNKLQEKFDAFFEQENADSFDLWLTNRRWEEIISSFGEGEIISIGGDAEFCVTNTYIPIIATLPNCDNLNAGNTQYAMAA